MSIYDVYEGVLQGIENMSWAEGLAVFFAIVSVFASKANSVWVYPTGIAGILISISIFVQEEYRLYPDIGLSLYYLVMSVYGWYVWTRKDRQQHETPVSWCSRKELLTAGLIFAVLWAVLYWWLSTYKINNVPGLDSFCSAMGCSGMWLLARRKIENWLALLIADAVAIPLFFIKKLMLFCALNIFYVVIAWLGFLAWKKIREKQMAAVC
ncbi:nicotinamide riboside transporter PnuC [Compostibacter hankyongensis]|uniref:Nicotinamide riboside transporter PnuC n=1 Tax=Compostibacter hankyongensis TaxID=1007089 RepID=A0ABP8FCH9_9BACT